MVSHNEDIVPPFTEDHSLINPGPIQDPNLQEMRPTTLADLFKMPYHQLALFHFDSKQPLPDTNCFYKSVRSLKIEAFKNDPLLVKEDLDWEVIQRFALFRFWVAFNRFEDLQENIRGQYVCVVPSMNFNLGQFSPADADTKKLKKCLYWHLSRGLLEDERTVVERTVQDLPAALNIIPDPTVEPIMMVQKTDYSLKRIIQAPIFQQAIARFGSALGKELTLDDLSVITEELKKLKLVAIQATHSSLTGMVLPDGLALNIGNIRKLVQQENPENLKLIKQLESENRIQEIQTIREEEKKKFEQDFPSASLWVALHELGHVLVRTKAICSPLYFGKTTPPTQIQDEGMNYDNLEGGFLFSSIFLGSFAKKIWSHPELMKRLSLPEEIGTIPVFNPHELANIPRAEVLNIRNSGSFSIKFPGYEPITL